MKELTVHAFKKWLKEAVNTKKFKALRFLSIADFYRQFIGKEPRYKNPNKHAFDYNKPFRDWAKNVWKPFLHDNYDELGITNVMIGRHGLPLNFKPKS